MALKSALDKADPYRSLAASRAVIKLFDEGGLKSLRLAIAHEREGDLLTLAQSRTEAAERATDSTSKQVHLAIAAFSAGAALEDPLRRLCDAHGTYDLQRASIAKLRGWADKMRSGAVTTTASLLLGRLSYGAWWC